MKAELDRELEDFSLNCSKCGLDVHWVGGLGITPGHWAHGRARATRRARRLAEELEPLHGRSYRKEGLQDRHVGRRWLRVELGRRGQSRELVLLGRHLASCGARLQA